MDRLHPLKKRHFTSKAMSQQSKPDPVTRSISRSTQVLEFVYGVRRKVATGGALLLALLLGYHIIFGQNGITIYEQKRHEARELQSQIQDLQQENAQLKDHVDRLKQDPDAIEHQAREELHYTRPGEVIYALPPASAQPQTPAQSKK
ncbi:MAG: FtsB family cell division protein [Acidobacteriaceae bacterium]